MVEGGVNNSPINLETLRLPPALAKRAKKVPDAALRLWNDSRLHRQFGGPLEEALRGICVPALSEQEWGALLEAESVAARFKEQEENIKIAYGGPEVEGLTPGVNELSISEWASCFGTLPDYRTLLFSLVRSVNPRGALELGTGPGLSGLYISLGIAVNGVGTLHSVEADAEAYAVGKGTLWSVRDIAQTYNGRFEEVAPRIMPEIPSLDFVYIDGDHTGEEETDYADFLAGYLSPGAVVVCNGVQWSSRMSEAWEEIRDRPEVGLSLRLGEFGILQTRATDSESPAFHLSEATEEGYGSRRGRGTGVHPENLTWIFGSPRSGTTWARDMMAEITGAEIWEEPFVGGLFGGFYELAQEGQLKAKNFIMGEPVRKAWIEGIRKFVLEVSKGRFTDIPSEKSVIVKEPSGSVGAPLLMEALPESRMILLVRDPRDVVASYLDASHQGSWLYQRRNQGWIRESKMADRDPEEFARRIGEEYAVHVGNAKRAFEEHGGPKTLVRYEDLVADTLGTMRRIYTELGIEVDEQQLERAVHKNSWENIPEDKKGEGKFYRKGQPGSWKDDLTEEQVGIVEGITSPLLEEFYG